MTIVIPFYTLESSAEHANVHFPVFKPATTDDTAESEVR